MCPPSGFPISLRRKHITREQVVRAWMCLNWGEENLYNMKERAQRVLEEALELAQCHGVEMDDIERLAKYVYSRPVGDAPQEVAGIGVTLLGYCAARGLSMLDLIDAEIKRVIALPVDHFRKKHAWKAAQGVSEIPSPEPLGGRGQDLGAKSLGPCVDLDDQHDHNDRP